jgi:hypothetical protein
MAGVTITKRDARTYIHNAISGTGGLFAFDYPIATDTVTRIHAVINGAHITTGHVDKGVSLYTQCAVKSANGTLTFLTAVATSANPLNSNTAGIVVADVQAYDDNFSTCTAVWTISGTNARLTVTNNGSIAGDFVVFVDAWTSDSS